MIIGLPATKLLWGRSGGLCSLCQTKLSEDKKTSHDSYPFGEMAHIIAEENEGPRGKSILTAEQRNSYPNLILLCPTCHTKIDKSVNDYPVELLHQKKSEHELWFEKSRVNAADKLKRTNDYIYAEFVDAAAKLCMFETWRIWTSWGLSTHPQLQESCLDNINGFAHWTIQAVWPGTIPELENSLKTLSYNVKLFANCFSKNCHRSEKGWLREIRFYQNARSTKEYDKLLEKYNDWSDQLSDSLVEATKSANWVAEVVRREMDPMFFAVPGKFAINYGADRTLGYTSAVFEYSVAEKASQPSKAFAKLKAFSAVSLRDEEETSGEQ